MSTKTLRKRIALVAVSALGAGLLSVISLPAAKATTGTQVDYVYENITDGGAAVVSATTANNGSYGLQSVGALATAAQNVTMYSNGVLVVATSAANDKAMKITVGSGGRLSTVAGAAKCFGSATSGTVSYSTTVSCSVADAAGAASSTRLFAAVEATSPGTFTITGDEDTAAGASTDWTINVTVLNTADIAAAGGTYANSTTTTSQKSQGVISFGTSTGLNQTATMYSNGVLTVESGQVATAQKITVSGGRLAGADKVLASGGTLSVSGDLTSATLSANAANQLFASFAPNAAGTNMVITGYDDSSLSANWMITVTVVAVGSSGTFNAGNSNIALTAAGAAPASANIDTAGVSTVENGTCAYLYYDLKDANNLELPTSASVIGKTSAGFTVAIGATTGTLPIVTGTYGGAATYLKACQDSNNTNKAVSGTLTLTVNGVDVATRNITIVGQLAKITVTEGAIAIRNFGGGAGTPSNALYGASPYGTAGSGLATWAPSHTYVGYDASGNLVPVTAAIVTTTLDAQVTGVGQTQAAAPRNANAYLQTGGLTFACADASGSNAKVQVKASAADTTTITSNVFNVTCAESAVNYTAATDKTTYNTGDVMTVTVKGTDKSGKPANDYAKTSATTLGSIASGAIKSTVTGPAAGDTFSAGSAKYRYTIDQNEGNFTVAVDFPDLDSSTYSQTALTLPITVKSSSTTVTNAQVLASIVKLIAAINKQIAALQKALKK